MNITTGTNVLVLNASYEPLQHVSIQHAIRMLVREVAIVEEAAEFMFGEFVVPKVLRLVRYVKMHWKYGKNLICTKKGVLLRDNHTCAYCAKTASTVDHILPSSRGGGLTWENSVAACFKCNNKKANRTPDEARMRLLVIPVTPRLATAY